jgi:uncharacterized CHY-type Zn-finger protein
MSTPIDVYGTAVFGVEVGAETRCAHYDGETDVIAIRFPCCDRFYPCHACHDAVAGHPAEQWPVDAFDTPAVLCGACGHVLTIGAYLQTHTSSDAEHPACPACGAAFNPGCHRHRHLYFEPAATGDKKVVDNHSSAT